MSRIGLRKMATILFRGRKGSANEGFMLCENTKSETINQKPKSPLCVQRLSLISPKQIGRFYIFSSFDGFALTVQIRKYNRLI